MNLRFRLCLCTLKAIKVKMVLEPLVNDLKRPRPSPFNRECDHFFSFSFSVIIWFESESVVQLQNPFQKEN